MVLFQALDSAKIDLSQNQDKWDTEKTKILQQHNTKVQEKETEVQKMSELQSDLESAKYDLEKEREALIELSDKLDAKEVASEKLEGIVKQLQTDMATELAAKKSLVAELDDAKTSMATNINTTNDLKSENDDLQVSSYGFFFHYNPLKCWPKEKLRILFYEAKMPTSVGYSTI